MYVQMQCCFRAYPHMKTGSRRAARHRRLARTANRRSDPIDADPTFGRCTAPSSALAAAARSGSRGPVFNSEGFGGYLTFRGIPTFIDGRAELYGNAFLDGYLMAERGDKPILSAVARPVRCRLGHFSSRSRVRSAASMCCPDGAASIRMPRRSFIRASRHHPAPDKKLCARKRAALHSPDRFQGSIRR